MECEGEGRLLLSAAQTYALGSIFFIESLFVICTNLLLLLSVIKTKELDTTSKKYIFLLNFSDFFIGLVGIPSYGMLFTMYGSTPFCELHMAAKFLVISSFYFTFCVMLLIALDRSVSIVPELDSPSRIGEFIQTSYGFNFTVILSIAVALCLGGLSIIDNKVTRLMRTATTMCANSTFILLYIYLYLKVHRFTKSTRAIMNNINHSETETTKNGYSGRFKKTVLILVGVVNLCLIPTEIIQIVGVYLMFARKELTPTIWFLYYLSVIPVFANSGFNSIIILYRNRKLKNCAFYWLLKRLDLTVQQRSRCDGNTNTEACEAPKAAELAYLNLEVNK